MRKVYKNILVAVDGSEQAENALKEAVETTKRNNGHLVILTTVDTAPMLADAHASNYIAETSKNYLNSIILQAELELPEGFDYETVKLEDNPKTAIVKYAEDNDIDLIMIGATGKGRIERALIGSTTAFVVNNAPCNVMVVK